MKKISFLFFFCFLVAGVVLAQVKVVEHPRVEDPNTDAVNILKVELSESSTILWLDIYSCAGERINVPSRTVLQSRDGQRTYKLLNSEGLEMDKWVIIPEKGYVSCRLTFEPLRPEEKVIDYVEGPGTGTWLLQGIHLFAEKETKGVLQTRIRGEVRDRPYSPRLILIKADGDSRVDGIYIPVREGKFEYVLNHDEPEAYDLIFEDEQCKGGWRPVTFVAEGMAVDMVLYPEDHYDENCIKGGPEATKYQEFVRQRKLVVSFDELEARREELDKAGRYWSAEHNQLTKQLSETKDRKVQDSLLVFFYALRKQNKEYTSEGAEVQDAYLQQVRKMKRWEMDYFRKNPSLACYYLLMGSLAQYIQSKDEEIKRFREFMHIDEAEVKELFNEVYRPLFPHHRYTREMETAFRMLENIKVGGMYIDFTAPDLETGKEVRLSEQIEGKMALIDLWASWCGPCRRHAMEMIPVYEKYKEKGFVVVGVAREKNASAGLAAARRDKYPWVNLLELNDQQQIWNKYGIGNAGGSQFLVDRDGKILLVSPTVEEVERILEKEL